MAQVLSAEQSLNLPKYKEDMKEIKSFLKEFKSKSKDEESGELIYQNYIEEARQFKRSVIPISLADLADSKQSDLVDHVVNNTVRYIELFEDVIDEEFSNKTSNAEPASRADMMNAHRISSEQANGAASEENYESKCVKKELDRRYDVVFTPDLREGYRECSIREVDSSMLGHYVTIKGMISRVGEMLPMVRVATYICRECGYENYQRVTRRTFTPLKKCTSEVCLRNKSNGDLVMYLPGFKWVKYQEVVLQETSDQIPTGNIPRVLNVHLKGSLTQSCVPGDIVAISGCFLPTPYTGMKALRAGLITDTYFSVHHVHHFNGISEVSSDAASLQHEIKRLSRDDNVYELLSSSLAPEIYGHSDIKKALLLQLIGGVTRGTEDGMKIRGDINILLMGDPGVAKSQLLKYISTVSPRGVYTTGKGSSSVGLTAGVLRDSETNELKVEGGALILADNGICCIDEFDKMSDSDRTSIHEVMEQQTISISKAGIQTTLNARVSLLCAANPLFGRYNVKKTPGENINLPTALLSRFDLIFLILDKPNRELDQELAEHIAYVHKNGRSREEASHANVPISVIRGYINEAQKFEPYVPNDLVSYIADTYVNNRQIDLKAAEKNGELTSLTARQLLSILRLAQAHAKLHFYETVRREDVDEALRLMYMSKASVMDTEEGVTKKQDVMSAVYAIIREAFVAFHKDVVDLTDLEAHVLRKGFNKSQFQDCIEMYSESNVWTVTEDGNGLMFIN